MWMPVFGPLPKPQWFTAAWKVGYVIAVRFAGAILGNVLMWSGTVLYPIYAPGERYWGISPLADQSTAGVVMMVEGTFLGLGLLAWVFFEASREGIEKQRLLDLAQDRGVELDAARAQRAVAAGQGERLEKQLIRERRPSPSARDESGVALIERRAWLVTGPLGRGLSFAIDFAAARCGTLLAPSPSVDRLGSRVRCRPLSPSCPTRASASRSRFPPRTSSAPPRAPPARWRRRCGCPASARARRRPRW